ncbi:ComEC/Rec2 family competence protein [Glacieibacterium megasporae]|uniref:ComEC/Rec2 family competence protein n=1 Tax=Glacieibacterium megasporae TaxID=2835787 RepID=UPI001C1E2820|nr:MBL fold metallo-hydrolase [Polymorphobacter megasporae]UAJ08696.1 MBL fold metallo-hydrolase [Polymorphobacter megasporae]
MMKHAILIGAAALALGGAAPRDTLRMVLVDVEGGSATLYVTPEGHSLLVDTGWPKGMGGPAVAAGAMPPPATSSAERIVRAAKALGLSRIDYVLVTHYHVDHVGGVQDLLALIPVGTFVDHGPNREVPPSGATAEQLTTATATLYPKYLAAIAGRKHIVMQPGATLKIDGLVLNAVDADGQVITHPLAQGGKPGVGCDRTTTKDANGGEENPRSIGFLATWGKARILSLGDTTWNVENRLVCPVDLIGPIDLMVATHHGSDLSNSPALLDSVAPRFIVVANGPTKGGDAATFDTAMASPRLKELWQLHYATRSGPEKNAPRNRIANLPGAPDMANALAITVDRSGAVAVAVQRGDMLAAGEAQAR